LLPPGLILARAPQIEAKLRRALCL